MRRADRTNPWTRAVRSVVVDGVRGHADAAEPSSLRPFVDV